MFLFNRKYKSGSSFAVWRWTDIETDGSLYLRRLHLLQIPHVGAVMLHWIVRPDRARDLHDHPVSFLSIVLRGSYTERVPSFTYHDTSFCTYETQNCYKQRYIRWWNYKRAADSHRITYVFGPRGVLTLVFAGPKRRNWGFLTAEGWVRWQDYKENN